MLKFIKFAFSIYGVTIAAAYRPIGRYRRPTPRKLMTSLNVVAYTTTVNPMTFITFAETMRRLQPEMNNKCRVKEVSDFSCFERP